MAIGFYTQGPNWMGDVAGECSLGITNEFDAIPINFARPRVMNGDSVEVEGQADMRDPPITDPCEA